MFAVTYSTQAILPELARSFGVGPAQAGLTIFPGVRHVDLDRSGRL
jgi:hypothetical protein